ncbi:MAG TPA: response regulator transcription factor [Vicinamibacterales bacterium]|nr:response regulator transcription factor [Vicinamibacterales bacterium]
MESIVLVSDNADLALLLRGPLAAVGFRLSLALQTPGGLIESLDGGHCVVLLDATARGSMQMLQWCRLRSTVPIVVVSPHRHRAELVAALESGAADYIAGPLDPDEVIARIRAVLRRERPRQSLSGQTLDVGGIQIAPAARAVRVCGALVELTSVEYDILEYLVREAGRAVSRDELMAAACRRQASPLDRSLDVHVSHLRRKLLSHGTRIRTVRGIGYMMALVEDVPRRFYKS